LFHFIANLAAVQTAKMMRLLAAPEKKKCGSPFGSGSAKLFLTLFTAPLFLQNIEKYVKDSIFLTFSSFVKKVFVFLRELPAHGCGIYWKKGYSAWNY
jgi:hypothetical protein